VPAYRDPKRSAADDPGLIAALMRVPSTHRVRPEENQFSEALAWALRRAATLARDFALLFVAGDTEAEQAVRSAAQIGVDTRITVRGPSGKAIFPDLSLCGSDRSFQLLVEVKVDATFHEYDLPDGASVSQPVAYAHALECEPAASSARVRRVGTLSKDPAAVPKDAHPIRGRDVSWAQVRDLLAASDAPPRAESVFGDLRRAITIRILPTRPLPDEVEPLLKWGESLLAIVLPELARVARGTTRRPLLRRGAKELYAGGYVDYLTPDGHGLAMWVYVSPEGAAYSVPGEPGAVCIQPNWNDTAPVSDRLSRAFLHDRDIAGYDAWRQWLPVAEVEAAGDLTAQAALVIDVFANSLSTCELIRQRLIRS
jgi:hypothetical protein